MHRAVQRGEKPYYLAPQRGGAKAYEVLRTALLDTRRVGIARFYLRTRPLLAALMPGKDVLSLEVMREIDELRDPEGLAHGRPKSSAAEVKMARTLIESMSTTWDPTEYRSTYGKALEKLLARKKTFALPSEERAAEAPRKVVDLMDALRKSLAHAPGTRATKKPAGRRRGGARRGAAA